MSVQVSNDKIVHLNKGRGHFLFNGFLDSMTSPTLTKEEKINVMEQTFGPTRLDNTTVLSRGDVKLMRDTIEREYKDKLVSAVSTAVSEEQFVKMTGFYEDEFEKWVGKGLQPLVVTDGRFARLHETLQTDQTMLALMNINPEGYAIPYEKVPFFVGEARELFDVDRAVTETKNGQRQLVLTDLGTFLNQEDNFNKSARSSFKSFLIAPYLLNTENITYKKENVADLSLIYAETARNYLEEQRKAREEKRKQDAETKKPLEKSFRNAPRYGNLKRTEFEYLYEDTKLYEKEIKGEKVYASEQIEGFLGGLISKSDLSNIKTIVEDNMEIVKDAKGKETKVGYTYNPSVLNKAHALLGHLFDEGIDYSVETSTKYPNQLVAKLEDGSGAEVRILDTNEQEHLIGRVFTRNGSFFYSKQRENGKEDDWTPENIYAIIDYVTGVSENKGYFTVMSKVKETRSSRVYLDSVSRPVNFMPIKERMDSAGFKTVGAAEAALRESIDTARMMFKEQLLAEDVDITDAELGDLQENLLSRLKEEDELLFQNSLTDSSIDYELASTELRDALINEVLDIEIGSYETGFHLGRVMEYNRKVSNFNPSERILTAMKYVKYDVDNKIIGNDFSTQTLKDRMVTFDRASAKVYGDETISPFYQEVLEHTLSELKNLGIIGLDAEKGIYDTNLDPLVAIDKNGIIRWQGVRVISATSKNPVFETVGTDIGQIFEPNEKGVVETKYNSGVDYGLVPGYRGHFQYSNISKPRMERFRAVGFEQLMKRKITSKLREQVMRPTSLVSNSILLGSDATSINKLYQGDAYAQRISLDWYENSKLSDEVKDNIIRTLAGRVRLSNVYAENATTFSVSEGNDLKANDAASTISATVDHKNLRELPADYNGYFDRTMTGTNYNQGIANFLAEGSKVNGDGSVTPAPLDENNEPAKSSLMELDYFKYAKYNAWDRNQMASSQLTTAHGVDKARTALMTFGGWNMEDAYVVSKEFAERNMIPDMESGELRPLKRGDKISDFGGNKGVIGLVVDRDMSPEDATKEDLVREVAIMKANPDLDVIGSPYSMISRHNAGVIKELEENIAPVYDENGNVIAESGELNIIITNQQVDKKSQTYSQEDLAIGKGRKASSQLGWALNQHNADGFMKEVFEYNDNSWGAFREYLIVTGYDMKADGTLGIGYTPHGAEVRNQFEVNPQMQSDEFLKQINVKGGMLKLPFELDSLSGVQTDTISILDASLRSSTTLINEEQKEHRYTNNYGEIYRASLAYIDAELRDDKKQMETQKQLAQKAYGNLQRSVTFDKLGGMKGENSKHSFIRENLMSKKLPNTATSVVSPDPRLPIQQMAVSQDVHDTLGIEGNENVMIFRDPVLRGGAIRGVSTKVDETLTGIAINPLITKSMDADFDGDTYGVIRARTKDGQRDVDFKLAVEHNLIDKNSEIEQIDLNISMDVLSGALNAGLVTRTNPEDEDALSPKQQLAEIFLDAGRLEPTEKAVEEINRLTKVCLREGGFGSASVYLSSKDKMYESFKNIVDDGAKGSPKALETYMDYYNDNITEEQILDTQYATGAKSDFTGVAGSFSQKLMKSLRDTNPTVALETTYVITQGTLQIKHDAERGRQLDEILNHDLRGLLNGKSIDDKKRKLPLTKEQFKKEMRIVYNDKLDVDLREETLEELTELLSLNGRTIEGVDAIAHRLASPIDQIAYGGGLEAIHALAKERVSLNHGKKSSLIIPKTMKNADETTILAKKGTLDKEATAEKEKEFAEALDTLRAEAEEERKAQLEFEKEIEKERERKRRIIKEQTNSSGVEL